MDIEQYKQVFFAEATEGLALAETTLLSVDSQGLDTDAVNTIFRVAHSIKGASATLGLADIANFTHAVETLLDTIRSGGQSPSDELTDVLLKSVDGIRTMLQNDDAEHDHTALKTQIDRLIKGATDGGHANGLGAESPTVNDGQALRVEFVPNEGLFRTGNDPLRIFREIKALTSVAIKVDTSNVPALAELDPEHCVLAWELLIEPPLSETDVRAVFEWVEDECKLDIKPANTRSPAEHATDDTATSSTAPAPCVPAKSAVSRRSPARRAVDNEVNTIRVHVERVDALMNAVGELVITQSMIEELRQELEPAQAARLLEGLDRLQRNTRDLQERVMQIRMLPISFAFNRLPRLVHDLSRQLGKKAEIKASGANTELDKTLLEHIADPLVHLVRNALDHGIEPPDTRKAKGKPQTGTIGLNAFHKGGNIIIEISDDGEGLDRNLLIATGQKRGVIGDEDLSDAQAFNLIFQPGFSTAERISDISGRGVGMDVVARNISSLGGSVEVRSTRGVGTTFSVRLPLTLSILDGQLVQIGHHVSVVPLVSIVESLQVRLDELKSIASAPQLYHFRDEYIPVIRLDHAFDLGPAASAPLPNLLVVVESSGQRAGLLVDRLLGQQQVVIKSLETNFRRIDGFSGATILGDGRVVTILDVGRIVEWCRVAPRNAHAYAHAQDSASYAYLKRQAS